MEGEFCLIKHIFFDLGLTLVKNNLPERFWLCAMEAGYLCSLEEVMLAYHLANKHYMSKEPKELGKESEGFLVRYLSRIAGFLKDPILDPDFFTTRTVGFLSVSWEPYSWTIPTLHILKSHGFDIGLISNWDLGCRTILSQTKLEALLDPIVISSEVQIEKPDKRIFALALGKKDWKHEECLYVGDNYYDDARGAAQVGMPCCLINPFDRIGIEELDHPHIVPSIASLPLLLNQGVFDHNDIG